MNKEIFEQLKEDFRANPPVIASHSDAPPVKFKFADRGGKFYVTADFRSFPRDHEPARRRFQSWLRSQAVKYQMAPHVTSGGCGSWTYRLNGDPVLSAYL